MSEWNGFTNLDLSNVGEDVGFLDVGEHVVKCTDAEIKDGKRPGAKQLALSFESEDGTGMIRQFLNIINPSEQAQNIAQRQLKTFLTVAGHPSPDRPGDINSLKGLRCKITVGDGKPWTGDDGQERSYKEVKRYLPVTSTASVEADTLDDEIPF